ncbi:MAG: MOSC domain-containing protein [Pyrinomonadaceae bacterium]
MHISEINIYPIKSLKSISLQSAKVEERGLQHDRRWMLVDEKRRFLTQREFPVMSRIRVSLSSDLLEAELDGRAISVPTGAQEKQVGNVAVWNSSVKAAFFEPEVDEWFSEVLGTRCQLAAMTDISKRLVNPFYAVRRFKDVVSFADGYPFLLIGEGSLADLNERLGEPVPMNRFRPNFVVAGSEPFAEDSWKKIRIGDTLFHVVKPCARCVMTTIDQTAGEKSGTEPLKTLATYRNKRGKVMFGQNLIADASGGTINVGDPITVLSRS